MKTKPKILIVEDKVEDRTEVTNYLADEQFCDPEDIVDMVGTVDEAIRVLESKSSEIDLVLLDLNLPAKLGDSTPEKLSGKRVLDIVESLNGRGGVLIRVIVVSGEDIMEIQSQREMYEQQYVGCLLAITQKADLASTLRHNLHLFYCDPLRDRIEKMGLDVLSNYDKIVDPDCEITAKLDEAVSLAIRLLRNEMDRTYGRVGASAELSDDLGKLIIRLKEERFEETVSRGRSYYNIRASSIQSPGGWEAFLWRGSMEQHFQTLRMYRNDYVHIRSKPFQSEKTNDWKVPESVMTSLENGNVLSQVIELIVKEILDWYLPWHEQVYKPWREKMAK